MLKLSISPTLALGATCLAIAATAPVQAEDAALVFSVNQLTHDGGQLGVNLFRAQSEMFEHPYKKGFAQIKNGQAQIIFKDLPRGDYAAVAFHDENANRDLDHNVLRFPAEPLGFTGGFELGIFSGMPTFQKLKFAYPGQLQHITIAVK
ncbi:MAG: DUF2141 domain-containing protein [Gammaproteobacteria bacterium]|nr:DUF2141 domain-containing protein [Gammaproteobacteria bacterium]MDH5692968.1 DUF2141 domain-containing protein [Gammaproteobacteria bacterium]